MTGLGRNTIVAALIAASSVLAGPVLTGSGAAVADEGGNFFVGLRTFGGWSDPGDITGNGTATLEERNTADLAAGFGGVLGYNYGTVPWRVEAEILHRVRVDVDLRDNTNLVGYENNLSSTTFMLGTAYEWRGDSNWTPSLGAMVGWARNTSDVERTNLANGVVTSTEETDDNLALAATAGLDYAISETVDLGAAYRFSYLGMFDTGALAGGESIDGDPFLAHDLVLSLQFNF